MVFRTRTRRFGKSPRLTFVCNLKPLWARRYVSGRLMLYCAVAVLFAAGCMPPSEKDDVPAQKQAGSEERPSLLHRSTRDNRDASQERRAAGAQETQPRTSTNVIRRPFDAVLGARTRIAKAQMQQALNTYNALNGRYPKDYAEFKREILDANPSLQLPDLPAGQAYGYDAEKHELVILEYPDRKSSNQ